MTDPKTTKSFLDAWWPAIACAAAIFILSSCSTLPEVPGPKLLEWDKAKHFIAYGALGFCMFRGAIRLPLRRKWHPGAQVLLLGALYGASDEFHQRFVPGRSMDPHDWLADISGLAVAVVVIVIIRKFKAYKKVCG